MRADLDIAREQTEVQFGVGRIKQTPAADRYGIWSHLIFACCRAYSVGPSPSFPHGTLEPQKSKRKAIISLFFHGPELRISRCS